MKISSGKRNNLFGSFWKSIGITPLKRRILDFAMMCLLIQPYSLLFSLLIIYLFLTEFVSRFALFCLVYPASYAGLVQFTQSGLPQCKGHPKPPCHLLHLESLLPRVRDFNPMGRSYSMNYIYHSRHTQKIKPIATLRVGNVLYSNRQTVH